MRKFLAVIGVLGALGLAGYFGLTAPATWSALHPTRDAADAGPAVLANGHIVFDAGGCGTCHATPGQPDQTRLGGGLALTSGYGTFYMPNISPDPKDGIGRWTQDQFIRSMREGVTEHGANQYPAFPYTSFQRMTANDLRDMFAYIGTLPKIAGKIRDHDLAFPFTMRRGVGLWKLVFLDGAPLAPAPGKSAAWLRGQYLVEGPGHCAECHSPRNAAGAISSGKRFAGAPDPEGRGYVPNITQNETGIIAWSKREIGDYLASGLTLINIAAGGSMAPVIANTARLSAADREGMAEYIKSIAGIDAPNAGVPPLNRSSTIRMLPASTATVKSPAAALAASRDETTKAAVLYTVATKQLFLDRAHATATGPGDGRVLPAAKLAVVARDGDWLQVRIDGWQQKGAEAAVYALQGQRILVAALGQEALAKVVRQTGIEDPATKQNWAAASLTAWVTADGLTPDLAKIWSYSQALYDTSCGNCHALRTADSYSANQWVGSLKSMKRFTALEDGQYRLLQAYLQFHAKDTAIKTPAAKL